MPIQPYRRFPDSLLRGGDVRVSLESRLKGVFCSVRGQRGSLCRQESANLVIPAQAGIQSPEVLRLPWLAPAFAGVTIMHGRNRTGRLLATTAGASETVTEKLGCERPGYEKYFTRGPCPPIAVEMRMVARHTRLRRRKVCHLDNIFVGKFFRQ